MARRVRALELTALLRSALLCATTGVLCLGCEGTIEGAASSGQPGVAMAGSHAADIAMRAADPELFANALRYFPTTDPVAAPGRLMRLTLPQLDATTRALLPAQHEGSLLESMPRDPLQTNYEYAENLSFNAANFTPYTRWVDTIAAGSREQPASVIDCAATNPTASCLTEKSEKFVTAAFRGVVDPSLLRRYSSFFLSSVSEVGLTDATADLVSLTLSSPYYVFRDEVPRGTSALAAAQKLQGITYMLADAPPAAIGLSAADAPALVDDPAERARTIDRVLQSPAAREKLLRFFVAWLEVKAADEFTIATDVFPEFTPVLATAAIEETRAFLRHQLTGAAPKLKAITQSTQSFVSDAVATIYRLQRASGAPALVELDPEQRLGILTQPAVIASHSGPTTTRLVKRGVFFTRKIMCLPLGLPPAGVNTTLPEAAGASERERVQQATASPQCQGCHAYINPFGFMQENYDAIGRWRTTDQGRAIDASIELPALDDRPFQASSPVEALRGLTNSLRFQQCFARQVFRFYQGRDEQPGDDPVLRQMFFEFARDGGQDIIRMLQSLARASLAAEAR